MLSNDLGRKSILLFGTGNTTTFDDLREEGESVVGCDVCRTVVKYKKGKYGEASFVFPEELPGNNMFQSIVLVEVAEHFARPYESFSQLMSNLTDDGIICGTTNFYPGGDIEDGNDPGYMSHRGHVAYWSKNSLGFLVEKFGYTLAEFEMVRPGSVLPDEKFGQLWPNKRVFFIYKDRFWTDYFLDLKKKTPILPIDRP
jgi:hypothetical protein